MDAFFVEVERRRDPTLRGRPVVVGGTGPRGVVASASYEARVVGVRSAMPTFRARQLCPQGTFLPSDHRAYRAASEEVFEVFRRYTPLVEGLSLDEAFLDVSGLRLHYPDARAVASELRAAVRAALDLPASVGVATTKLVAKLASAAAKPDGLVCVRRGEELGFLHPLPVRALPGVGEATHAALEGLGIVTVGDLAGISAAVLRRQLGATVGEYLSAVAAGRDDRRVTPESEAKSISVEHTYDSDLTQLDVIRAELLRHCDRLAGRLRRAGVAGGTVAIKVRFDDFTTISRSLGLPGPTDVARDLYRATLLLLARVPVKGRPIRLLGVGATDLHPAGSSHQLAIDRPAGWDDLADAVEVIRAKFGEASVGPAGVVGRSPRPDNPPKA